VFEVHRLRNRSQGLGDIGQVGFILDGTRFKNASFLSNARLDQFESITINKDGFG
jgi:hypothetical protein